MRGIRSIGGIVLVLTLVGVRFWFRSNRDNKPRSSGTPVVQIQVDPQIEAASERARAKFLKDIAPLWAVGRPEGERLHVKSPFRMQKGGEELIWLDVESWSGNEIRGKLLHQPESVPDLNLGSDVLVQADRVFDYIRLLKDGSREGNETEDLILKKSMKK